MIELDPSNPGNPAITFNWKWSRLWTNKHLKTIVWIL
jgi:hypothetical protein